MTAIYYLLTFAAGLLFGILITSLAVMSGDKDKRDYDRLKKEYDEFLASYNDKPIFIFPQSLVPKDVTMDEFCKWWREEGYIYVKERAMKDAII